MIKSEFTGMKLCTPTTTTCKRIQGGGNHAWEGHQISAKEPPCEAKDMEVTQRWEKKGQVVIKDKEWSGSQELDGGTTGFLLDIDVQ